VIEAGGFIVDQSFFGVAVGAFFDLRIVFTLLKMTDEAGTFCDRDMLSLDNLGMTARALKTFSSL
jgi:hypothetical protein